jgi:predicted nucleotidyltransferase
MPENVNSIVYKFLQDLKRILGEKLAKVIVYGSYARGDYRDNSDVDIMILVKMSDEEIRTVKNDIYDLAFDVEMSTGIEISPVIKNEEQYEYWVDTLPFYRNVRDEGVVISE